MIMKILGILVVIACAVAGWIWLGPWIGGLVGAGSALLWNIIGLVIGLAISGPICRILFKRG